MGSSLYLINPRSEAASYFGGESYEYFGLQPAQSIADLARQGEPGRLAAVLDQLAAHGHQGIVGEFAVGACETATRQDIAPHLQHRPECPGQRVAHP